MFRRTLLGALLSGLALGSAPLAAGADSPFGINIHAPRDEQLGFSLDRVTEAGLGWVRIDLVWADVEPKRGVEKWKVYDELVAAARARGLEVLAIVAYTPAWATDGPVIAGVPRDPRDWSGFCERAARRYRGQVAAWEIWNEPNLPRFWAGSRAEYIEKILLPAARALRVGDADALVGGPGLAHHVVDGRDWHGWLLDVLAAAGEVLDFLSHHAYDLDDPAGVFDRLEADTPHGGDPARWGEAEPSLREVLAEARFDRPVWLTETGWVTTRIDESRQALHYQRFLDLWLGGGAPAVSPAKVFFYELQDDPDPQVPKFGLLRASGRKKPAFQALRDFIVARDPDAGSGDPEEEPPAPEPPGPRKPPPD